MAQSYRLRPSHSAVITVFTGDKLLHDMEVIIEPRILSENEMSCETCPVEFQRIMVACTLTTWLADGSVAVQIANPSSESIALQCREWKLVERCSRVPCSAACACCSSITLNADRNCSSTCRDHCTTIHSICRLPSPLISSQQFWIYVQNTVPGYRYHNRSWVSASLPKRRSPSPLIPNF